MKFIFILALLSRSIFTQTIDLPDDIDIKSSHIGIVELPERVHSRWRREGFVNYTKVIAPNNGAIHIVAQNKISQGQIIRARNVLEHFLTDLPNSQFGYDKSSVANAMANNEAFLLLLNGRDDGANEPDLPGQWLFEDELVVEGSSWYMNNVYDGHRDATFEEILHLVHDTGIGVDGHNSMPGSLPKFQKKIREATINAMSNGYHIWPIGAGDNGDVARWVNELDVENSLSQEYIASVVDSYYGLWGAWNEEPGKGMWGLYISNNRLEIKSEDPMGWALMEMFFHPYLQYTAWIDSSFNGQFSIRFNEELPYTHKSQYLVNVKLNGSENSDIIGNRMDNTLAGNSGNNMINGGEGIDSVVYSNNFNDYIIITSDDVTHIEDKNGDFDGKDSLFSIEYLVFKDKVISTSKLLKINQNIILKDYGINNIYPNPFNPSTKISYELPEDGFVRIGIYNTLGREIKNLVKKSQNAGQKIVFWDGTDDTGISVSNGIYFVAMNASSFNETKKIMLIR